MVPFAADADLVPGLYVAHGHGPEAGGVAAAANAAPDVDVWVMASAEGAYQPFHLKPGVHNICSVEE